MRNKQVEQMLFDAGSSLTPNVYEQILNTRVVVEDNHKKNNWLKKLIVAVSIILTVVLIGGFSVDTITFATEYQSIYMEVNPSVRVDIDAFNRVQKVEYLNDEARTLLEGKWHKKMLFEDFSDIYIDTIKESGYIGSSLDNLFFSVLDKNVERASKSLEKFNKQLNDILKEKGIDCGFIGNNIGNGNNGGNNTGAIDKDKFDKVSPAKRLIIRGINEVVKLNDETIKTLADLPVTTLNYINLILLASDKPALSYVLELTEMSNMELLALLMKIGISIL